MLRAIILNWNGLEATRRCLASLPPDVLPLVVDNGSTDGSAAALADVPLLALPENRGFAGGMNAGAARALAEGATHLLLLNNDAELAPDTVAKLMSALGDAAAAAPTIYQGQPPARDRLWYAGGHLGHWTATTRHQGQPDGPVNFLSGCVLLLNARHYQPFDERYFLYFEDADLCERLTAAGHPLLYVAAAEAWHVGGAATGSQHTKAPALDYYDLRNGLRFIAAHRHGPARLTALAYLAFVRLPRKLLRILATSPARGPALRAVWHGLRDGLAGRTGPFPEI